MPLQIPIETVDGTLYEPGKGVVEGRLILSCPSSALTSGQPEWRVESLELVRGRRVDEPKPGSPVVNALLSPPAGGPRPGGM